MTIANRKAMRPKARATRLAEEISSAGWRRLFWLMADISLLVNRDMALLFLKSGEPMAMRSFPEHESSNLLLPELPREICAHGGATASKCDQVSYWLMGG